MRVRCVHPGLKEELRFQLETRTIDSIAHSGRADCSGLECGLVRVVYGLGRWAGLDGYYIADTDYSGYPMWYPAVFFQIVDPRSSRYWQPSIWTPPGRAGSWARVILPWAAITDSSKTWLMVRLVRSPPSSVIANSRISSSQMVRRGKRRITCRMPGCSARVVMMRGR